MKADLYEILAIELATGFSFDGRFPVGFYSELIDIRPIWKEKLPLPRTVREMAEMYLRYRLLKLS